MLKWQNWLLECSVSPYQYVCVCTEISIPVKTWHVKQVKIARSISMMRLLLLLLLDRFSACTNCYLTKLNVCHYFSFLLLPFSKHSMVGTDISHVGNLNRKCNCYFSAAFSLFISLLLKEKRCFWTNSKTIVHKQFKQNRERKTGAHGEPCLSDVCVCARQL